MLRLSIFISLFLCSSISYGQRKPRERGSDLNTIIMVGDSLEKQLSDGLPLGIKEDTLPISQIDENLPVKGYKIVRYYYNSSKTLRVISYVDGYSQEGSFYFYYQDDLLIKVRVIKQSGLINSQYYFTEKDNKLTDSEIEQAKAGATKKEKYDTMEMGRRFKEKFKSFL